MPLEEWRALDSRREEEHQPSLCKHNEQCIRRYVGGGSLYQWHVAGVFAPSGALMWQPSCSGREGGTGEHPSQLYVVWQPATIVTQHMLLSSLDTSTAYMLIAGGCALAKQQPLLGEVTGGMAWHHVRCSGRVSGGSSSMSMEEEELLCMSSMALWRELWGEAVALEAWPIIQGGRADVYVWGLLLSSYQRCIPQHVNLQPLFPGRNLPS